jgi:hypothetical protein
MVSAMLESEQCPIRCIAGSQCPLQWKKIAAGRYREKGHAAMETSRVILANESRLLRGMLRRVIARAPGLEVVGEVKDAAQLSSLIQQTNAQWVILSLWPEGLAPSAIESLLTEHSSLCILGMAADGSQARIKRADSAEEDLLNLSLGKLIAVLSAGYI